MTPACAGAISISNNGRHVGFFTSLKTCGRRNVIRGASCSGCGFHSGLSTGMAGGVSFSLGLSKFMSSRHSPNTSINPGTCTKMFRRTVLSCPCLEPCAGSNVPVTDRGATNGNGGGPLNTESLSKCRSDGAAGFRNSVSLYCGLPVGKLSTGLSTTFLGDRSVEGTTVAPCGICS